MLLRSAISLIFLFFLPFNAEASQNWWHFLPVDGYMNGLLLNNLDIQSLKHNIKISAEEKNRIRSQFMPQINLELDYNKTNLTEKDRYKIASILNWNIAFDSNHTTLADIEIGIEKIHARAKINELISELLINYSKLVVLDDAKKDLKSMLCNVNHVMNISKKRYLSSEETFGSLALVKIEKKEIINKIDDLNNQIESIKTRILILTGIEPKEPFEKIDIKNVKIKTLERFDTSLTSQLNNFEKRKAFLELNSVGSFLKPDINLYVQAYNSEMNLSDIITDDIDYEGGIRLTFNLFDGGYNASKKSQSRSRLMQKKIEEVKTKQEKEFDYKKSLNVDKNLLSKYEIFTQKSQVLEHKAKNTLMMFKEGHCQITCYLDILNEKADQRMKTGQLLLEIIENRLNYYNGIIYKI